MAPNLLAYRNMMHDVINVMHMGYLNNEDATVTLKGIAMMAMAYFPDNATEINNLYTELKLACLRK